MRYIAIAIALFSSMSIGFAQDLVSVPSSIDMGFRPSGCWMEPAVARLHNNGNSVTVTSTTIGDGFFVVDSLTTPFIVGGNGDKYYSIRTGSGSGEISSSLIVSYDNDQILTIPVTATAYTPACPDVWELARTISSFPYNEAIAQRSPLYNNYKLPGSTPDGYDAVYTMTFSSDMLMNAQVTQGANPKMALYRQGFEGKGGPGADNNYVGFGGNTYSLDFEDGDFGSMECQNDVSYPWALCTDDVHQGSYSMKSGNGGIASSSSSIQFTVEIPANGNMSFWAKISSEGNYDKGYFYIDDVTKINAISGNGAWTFYSFDVTAGTHTFKWKYTKDGSADANSDAFFVDDIMFYNESLRTTYQIKDYLLEAGTYYLVASSTDPSFSISVEAEALPAPVVASVPQPGDGRVFRAGNGSLTLSWKKGDYTKEYQVLMGETNPPTTVVVDWTSELTSSYETIVDNEKTYYWQVNERNSAGTTYGPVWHFTNAYIQPDANNRLYASPQGDGKMTGTSWANACPDLDTLMMYAATFSPKATVWVKEGTYVGDSISSHNAFTMVAGVNVYGGFAGTETDLSQRDLEHHQSILDGQNVQRVLYQAAAFTQNTQTTWDGFVIEKARLTGDTQYGAGAYLRKYGKLKNCEIRYDTIVYDVASYGSQLFGGGVYMDYGTLEDCEIYGNFVGGSNHGYVYGGGVYNKYGTLANCRIHDNMSDSNSLSTARGGGVYLGDASVMTHCSITNNTSEEGGGLYAVGGVNSSDYVIVTDCVMDDNHAEGISGGGGVDASYAKFTNCRISHNTSLGNGGGICSRYVYLTNCLVSNNTSEQNGGGIYASGYCVITNTTVVNNLLNSTSTYSNGAGIYLNGYDQYVTNSVIWGNRFNTAKNNVILSSGNVSIRYSAIEGGWNGEGNLLLASNNTGNGMTPNFAQPTSGVGATYSGGDWTLLEGSVLINKGTTTLLPNNVTLPLVDLSGEERVQQGRIDIGAYESEYNSDYEIHADSHNIIYVSADGTGDGSSWSNAVGDLNLAVSEASTMNPTAMVWVKQGTYTGDVSHTSAFFIQPGVSVYGGFEGTEAYDYNLSQRDLVTNASVLDGQNAQRVLYQGVAFSDNQAAVWDGFTIERGYLNGGSGAGAYLLNNSTLKNSIIRNDTIQGTCNGAGVYLKNATLENCEVYGNYAYGTSELHGGGVLLSHGTVRNCHIHDNALHALSYRPADGGGVFCDYSQQSFIIDCIIERNTSDNYGGGVYMNGVYNGYSQLTNSRIENNTSRMGGGVYTQGYSDIVGCIIANNTASDYGGGVYMEGAVNMTSCDIVNNLTTLTGTNNGAGIHASSTLAMTNCVVWGNKQNQTYNQYYFSYTPTVSFCAFQGGYGGTGNIDLSSSNEGTELHPCFVNPTEDAGAGYSGGDWSLGFESSLINMGTTEGLTLSEYDLAGNDRVQQGAIDIGALESPYNVVVLTPDAHHILYVTVDGAGAMDGSSWENATPNLQLAVNRAGAFNPKATVWVAQGTYQGNASAGNIAFVIPQGTEVYGSFVGNETYDYDLSLRDMVNHATILDGQNLQRVLYQRNDFAAANAAVWDGFTLINGRGDGAGVYLRANGELRNCRIHDNEGGSNNCYGGGVRLQGSSANGNAKLTNCYVYDNLSYYGGGICSEYGTIVNTLITGNEAHMGGGVYLKEYNTLYYCGIYNNRCDDNTYSEGAGIHVQNSNNTMQNSIVWGNTINQTHDAIGKVENLDMQYSASECAAYGIGNILLNENNVGDFRSPRFVNPEQGNWALQAGSILINKGVAVNAVDVDLNGDVRVQQGKPDMGPLESNYASAFDVTPDANNILYVSTNGTGNGSSWANACGDLQLALNYAVTMNPVPSIWVKSGIYYGSYYGPGAFVMMPGVNVYGGFAGNETADFDLDERDFVTNQTTLDGSNVNRVLYQKSNFTAVTSSTWDGFTFRNGYSSGDGAGVYMMGHSHLKNCVAKANHSNNNNGGGVYSYGISGASNTITNCEIHDNQARQDGGGLWVKNTDVANCIVKDNTAGSTGGGVNANYSNLVNCLVCNNSANYEGGMNAPASNVINTTIVNNTANVNVGGLSAGGSNSYAVVNTIVWGNKAGNAVDECSISSTLVNYCAIQGTQYSGTGNINLAADNDGDDPSLNYIRFLAPEYGIYQLQENSAVIGLGNNNVAGLPAKDLAGRNRIMDGTIELGAYEQYCTNYKYYNVNAETGIGYQFYGSLISEPGTYSHQWSYSEDCDSLVVVNVSMSSSIWYATTTGAGTKDGSSWANASDNLNTLLNNIAQIGGYSRKQVWVAGGTYQGYTSGQADFYCVGGVEVHGGFAGDETDISQRVPGAHPTILMGNSSRNLLAMSSTYPCSEESRALWEGMTLSGGKQIEVGSYCTLQNCSVNAQTIASGHLLGCHFTGFNDTYYKNLLRLNAGAILDSCYVHNNTCNEALVRAENATIRYSLFYNNTCTRNYTNVGEGKNHGAILNAIDNVLIDHCDFVNNRVENTVSTSPDQYLAMEDDDSSPLRQPKNALISLRHSTMQNTIVWGNDQCVFKHDFIAKDIASQINYCAIEAGRFNGIGNICLTDESVFLRPSNGIGHLINAEDADWNLTSTTMCLKQGSEGSDIGAFASEASALMSVTPSDGVIYVAQDGTGDGSSWENATSNLQYAVSHANTFSPVAQVWVKEGTYTDDGPSYISAFGVVADVEVYGGFAGTESSLEERDPQSHPTYLDGQNQQRVLYQNEPFEEGHGAIWDGFIIQNGYMTDAQFNDYQGAIILYPYHQGERYELNHLNGAGAALLANTTLRNTRIENCNIVLDPGYGTSAKYYGKGSALSIYGGIMDHVTLTNDTTAYVIDGSNYITMLNSYLYAVNTVMDSCDFNHNVGKAALYGCTVNNSRFCYNQVRNELPERDNIRESQLYADLTVMRNCKFEYNNAVVLSKRFSGSQYANTFHNCVIDHNNALAVLGHTKGNNDQFINCNIVNNKSLNHDSGAYPVSGGVFHNSVIWGNRNYSDFPVHFNMTSLGENCSFNHCAVEQGLQGFEDNVIALATANRGSSEAYYYPSFLAPEAGDYTLVESSDLIGAGDNSVVVTDKDILGYDRLIDETVEIGAYEYRCVGYREYSDVTMAAQYPFYGEWLTESGKYTHRWPISETCDSIVVLNLSFKHIIYVTETGNGLMNGTSWENAFGGLKDAAEYAGTHPSDLNQIWVAEGLYRGDGTSVNAFRLFPNTQLYGGLTGTELADYDLSQRDLEHHVTTLDGDYIQRVIYQVEDCTEESPLIIDGFIIKNGYSRADVNHGTAMFLRRHAIVRNCKITENYTWSGAEAIYMETDDVATCNSRYVYNYFENCEITDNQGDFAVCSDHTAFTNCIISSNDGAGVYGISYTRMENCELVRNGGRAIMMEAENHKYADPIWGIELKTQDYIDLTNCKITNNGGGILFRKKCGNHATSRIMSCLIANNTANNPYYHEPGMQDNRGGAICGTDHTIEITNSTIVNNVAQSDGGALYGTGYKVVNTILSGNKAGGKSNQLSNHYYDIVECELGPWTRINIETSDITYSAIEGGYPGEGNINLNTTDLAVKLSGNYVPQQNSPCVNNGTTQGITVPEYDLAGNSRVLQGKIDIGAYESNELGRVLIQPSADHIIYVSEEGSGDMDGSSWENATPHFQMALNFALSHDPKPQVWVKKGNYGDYNVQYWSNLAMMPGVNVYGGFNGDEPADFDLGQRDLRNNLSILDGHSSKRVLEQFRGFEGDDEAVWDGFHIKGGYAREGYVKNILYLSERSIEITFKDYMNGGGVWLHKGGHLSHCDIYDNIAFKGGGIYRDLLFTSSYPTRILNCKLRHNYAIEEGGAIYWDRFTGFIGFDETFPVDTIANCEISGNSSERLAALHTVRSNIIGSSIVKNTTELYSFDTITSSHQFNHYTNCVLWGNDSRNYAFQTDGRDNVYDYCAIQGGAPAENTGTGIINLEIDNTGDDPNLNYPFFLDDEEEVYRPTQYSSFVNEGDNECVVGSEDLAFKPRVKDEVVDMGAYEEACLNYEHRRVIANRSYTFYGRVLTESGKYEHQWTPEGAECDSVVSLDLEIRCIWYVKEGGSGTKDGSSWENATGDLNWAITQASACDTTGTKQIWVAQGTYHGDGSSAQAFTLKPDIEILGGFEGNEVENIEFDQRDFENHASILDGRHIQRVVGNYGKESSFSPIHRVTLDGFTIQNAYTTSAGGGVYAKNYITLKNLVVKNNQAGSGAGIYVDNHCEVTDCDIFSNTALGDGAGAYVQSSTLTYCEIYRNLCDNVTSGEKHGGGIYGENATINNCLIANNSVLTHGAKGGGMFIGNSTVASQLLNCTMVNNYSYDQAGGIYSCNESSNNEFVNCVLWGNRTDLNTQQIAVSSSNVPIYLRYCAVQGGAAGIGTIKLTEGNDTNSRFSPWFVSPSENVGANYGGGDWRIQNGSILANHGERMLYNINKDLDDETRVKNDRIDIGAYESNYTHDYAVRPDAHNTIYVDASNNYGGDFSGDSWANAIPDLQLAINFAGDDDNHPKIWIKGGTYTGNGWPYVDAFVAMNGIDLYGGFAGNESYDYDLDQRDLVANATILDGQNIQRTLQQAHNDYFKYKKLEELHHAVYDGLTLRNGFVFKNDGGVVRMQKGELNRCIIENGEARDGHAGGLYLEEDLLAVNNTIIRNCKTSVTLTTEHLGETDGGGYYSKDDRFKGITFHNCLLANNSSWSSGGAGCGGIHYNSTVVNNYAYNNGGGLFGYKKIYNSVLWGNKIGNNLPGQLMTSDINTGIQYFGDENVTYSAVEGGFSGEGNLTLNTSNTGNSNVNYPMFNHPSIAAGAGNGYVSDDDDWTIQEGSVLANRGNSEYAFGSYDLGHVSRVQRDVVDMGAYESPYDVNLEIVPDAHNIIYVTQQGAGQMNGSSWANATPYLQYAMEYATTLNPVPKIWTAAGNYVGSGVPEYPAFIMPDGVTLHGGFAGNESYDFNLAERDFDLNITRLDGQNLQQVMRHDYISPNMMDTITGITFQNGRSNREGGGASLTSCYVADCKFLNNTHVWEGNISNSPGGGALYATNCHIYHSTFMNNYSNSFGGAVSPVSSILNRCLIKNNIALKAGGGILGSCQLYNSEISYNQAEKGGGIYGTPMMRNCTVVKNVAEIVENNDYEVSSKNGGGILLPNQILDGNDPVPNYISNNIIWGNRTGSLVSNIRGEDQQPETISYTAIENDEYFPTGTGNIILQSDNDGSNQALYYVRFADPDNGDFTLQESSMCINVGNNATAAPGELDFAGNDRVRDDIVDLGAYEMTPVNCHVPTNLNVPVNELTFTTADVYWTPADTESEWLVYYMQVDDVTPMLLNVYDNHVQLIDLHPNTEYFVKVRSVCSETEMSGYTLPVYFTTACDPDSITWNNYLVEDGLLPARDQALQSNEIVLFSWDYIDGAESYDLYLWRTDHGNGLPVPDFPVLYGLTKNYASVDLARSVYQGYGPYEFCTGCDPEPPLYLYQYDTTGVAYYGWYVVAHRYCAEIRSDTMTFNTALPDLHVTALDCSYAQTGQEMTVTWTVKNDGVGPTPTGEFGTWNDYIVLSYPHNWTAQSFTQDDPESFIIDVVPNLTALNPGESYTNSVNVFVPDDMYGTVFLFVLTNWKPGSDMHLNYSDYGGVFPDPYLPPYIPHDEGDPEGYMTGTCDAESFHESVECDNFFYKRIEVDIPPYPDLIIDQVIPPYEGVAGDSIILSWRIINQGGAGFEDKPVTDVIYMTTDTVYTSSAKQVATYMDTIPYMARQDTLIRSMKFAVDERDIDTFNFFVRVDATNRVYESLFEGNNMSPVSVHSTILMPPPTPDLCVKNLTLGMDTVSPYEWFTVSYQVENIGYASAKPSDDPNYGGGISDSCGVVPPWRGVQWMDELLLSDQNVLDPVHATHIGTVRNDTILYMPVDFPTIDAMIMDWAECRYAVPDTLSANASHNDSVTYYNAVEKVPELIAKFYDKQHYYYEVVGEDSIQHNRYINSYTMDGKARAPRIIQEGKYYFYVWTDKNDVVFEYQLEDNNIVMDSIYVVQPDLTIDTMWIDETRDSLRYVLHNIGAGKMLDDNVRLTVNFNNAVVANGNVAIDTLCPGETYEGAVAIEIPCNFYEVNSLRLQANPVNDKDFSNNAILIEDYHLKNPDFLAHSLVTATSLNSGDSFDVLYSITNKGAVEYEGEIELGVYLGLSPELNFITAEQLDVITYPITLGLNDTVDVLQTVTLPIEAQGPYYIYIVVNDGDGICEGDNVYSNYIVSDLINVTLSPYPDFYVTDVSHSGSGTAGMSFSITYTATNGGIRAVTEEEVWKDGIYISRYPQFSTETAVLLEKVTGVGPLAIGDTYTVTRGYTLPNNLVTDTYYIYVVSDVNDSIFEYVGEYNNIYQSSSFPVQEYDLDLVMTSFTGPTAVEWTQRVTYQYSVMNAGSRSSVNRYVDQVYLSADATWDQSDLLLMTVPCTDTVFGGGHYDGSFTVKIPYGYLGTHYLLAVTDALSVNPDNNWENNMASLAIDISSIPVPDLMVSEMEVLTEYPACGQPISMRYKVTNVGDGPTYGEYTDQFVLSRNTFENGKALSTVTRTAILQPNEYYYDTVTFIVPVPETGNYALYVDANHNHDMYEFDFENNLAMIPLVVDMNAPGDLVVSDITFASCITAGNPLAITWTVTNLGPNRLSGVGCSDVIYLSKDDVFDTDDKLLGSIVYDLSLAENMSEQHSFTSVISGVQEGEYYIIIFTDARNTFYEIEEGNNRTASMSTVRVELPILHFNDPQTFVMSTFNYKDYKLEVGNNISETVRVYVTSSDSLMGAVNNIYVMHDGVPTNLDYDFSTDGQMTSNSELYIPRTERGYYGVSVFGYSPVNEYQTMTIEADILPFEIRSITPNHGGNTGKVTVKLIGSKFRHDMEVSLCNAQDTIHPDTLIYVNFNEVFVTFDLTGAALGYYTVRATNYCAGTTYLHNGFLVEEGEPENLATNLIIPSGLRANRYCCLTLEYGNIGNTDIVNPRIVLRSLGESWIGLRRGELNIHRTELEIPTHSDGEPDHVLRPGVRHTITIYCYTNAEMLFSIDVNNEIDAHEYIKNLMLH